MGRGVHVDTALPEGEGADKGDDSDQELHVELCLVLGVHLTAEQISLGKH